MKKNIEYFILNNKSFVLYLFCYYQSLYTILKIIHFIIINFIFINLYTHLLFLKKKKKKNFI